MNQQASSRNYLFHILTIIYTTHSNNIIIHTPPFEPTGQFGKLLTSVTIHTPHFNLTGQFRKLLSLVLIPTHTPPFAFYEQTSPENY